MPYVPVCLYNEAGDRQTDQQTVQRQAVARRPTEPNAWRPQCCTVPRSHAARARRMPEIMPEIRPTQ